MQLNQYLIILHPHVKYETVEINELGFAFFYKDLLPFDPAYIGYDKAFVKREDDPEYRISTSQLDDIMERLYSPTLNKILWDYLQGILILSNWFPTPPPVNPVPLPYLYHDTYDLRDTARDLDTRVEAYLDGFPYSVDDPTIPLRTLVSGLLRDEVVFREDNTVGVDIVHNSQFDCRDDKVIRVVGGGSLVTGELRIPKHGFVSSGLLSKVCKAWMADGDTNKVSVRCRGNNHPLVHGIDYHTRWPEIVVNQDGQQRTLWLPMETVEVWLFFEVDVKVSEGQIRIPIVARTWTVDRTRRHPTVIYDDFHLTNDYYKAEEGTDYTRDGNKIEIEPGSNVGLWIRMVIGEVPEAIAGEVSDAVKIVDNAPDLHHRNAGYDVYIPRNPEARIIDLLATLSTVYEYDADGLLLDSADTPQRLELTSGGYRGTLPRNITRDLCTDAYGYNAAAR
ncbi:hypothetical protein SPFM12_00012 [Salmonella phage SPFM12]|nr:hypothetical protein SPFM12_00012 [Salmonella phage SPFM12]